MPYSERSSIRPEAANYAVRGGGATLALRITCKSRTAGGIFCVVHRVCTFRGLTGNFRGASGYVSYRYGADYNSHPSISGMCNYFVILFKRCNVRSIRVTKFGLYENIDVIFFQVENHLFWLLEYNIKYIYFEEKFFKRKFKKSWNHCFLLLERME